VNAREAVILAEGGGAIALNDVVQQAVLRRRRIGAELFPLAPESAGDIGRGFDD